MNIILSTFVFSVFVLNICNAEISREQLEKFYTEYHKSPDYAKGDSDIVYAIQQNYAEIAALLIQKSSLQKNYRGCSEGKALTSAIRNHQTTVVNLLLDHGTDVNVWNGAPLKFTIYYWPQNIALVNSLIQRGANPSLATQEACRLEKLEILEVLLEAGADPTPALQQACETGNLLIVQALLNAGANPNSGNMSLITSTVNGYKHNPIGTTAVAALLLEKGVYPTGRLAGTTNLHYAARYNAVDIAELLLDYGVDANLKDNAQRIPLHEAMQNGHIEMAQLLIDHGAHVNYIINGTTIAFEANSSFLGAAILKGSLKDLEIVNQILKNGGDPNIKDSAGVTPLLIAVQKRNMEAAELLLDFGARPDIPCTYDWYNKQKNMVERRMFLTPVDLALETGQSQMYDLLLKAHVKTCFLP